jgi:hypothetical protein
VSDFTDFSDRYWQRVRHKKAIHHWVLADFSIHSYIANYPESSSAQSPSQDRPPCAGMGAGTPCNSSSLQPTVNVTPDMAFEALATQRRMR